MRRRRPQRLQPGARGRLVGATVLFPGLGHLLARRTGTGLARLLLAGSWIVGAVVILAGGGGGVAAVPAVPLLIGAAAVWGGSVRDVLALVDGRPELLRPRVLSWLTGGVLLTLVLLTVVAGGRAGAAG